MRFRPANIRVINRRDSRLGHHRYGVAKSQPVEDNDEDETKTRKSALMNKTLISRTS